MIDEKNINNILKQIFPKQKILEDNIKKFKKSNKLNRIKIKDRDLIFFNLTKDKFNNFYIEKTMYNKLHDHDLLFELINKFNEKLIKFTKNEFIINELQNLFFKYIFLDTEHIFRFLGYLKNKNNEIYFQFLTNILYYNFFKEKIENTWNALILFENKKIFIQILEEKINNMGSLFNHQENLKNFKYIQHIKNNNKEILLTNYTNNIYEELKKEIQNIDMLLKDKYMINDFLKLNKKLLLSKQEYYRNKLKKQTGKDYKEIFINLSNHYFNNDLLDYLNTMRKTENYKIYKYKNLFEYINLNDMLLVIKNDKNFQNVNKVLNCFFKIKLLNKRTETEQEEFLNYTSSFLVNNPEILKQFFDNEKNKVFKEFIYIKNFNFASKLIKNLFFIKEMYLKYQYYLFTGQILDNYFSNEYIKNVVSSIQEILQNKSLKNRYKPEIEEVISYIKLLTNNGIIMNKSIVNGLKIA